MRAWLFPLLLALGLSGCGFKLAGADNWPADWPGYRIDNRLAGIVGEDFAQKLRVALAQDGLDPAAEPAVTLRLLRLDQRKHISALDANGRAAEFELQNRLRFQVLAGGHLSPEYAVVAQRRLSFDPSLALAKQQEEAQIGQALAAELIELLILRVEAELQGLRAVVATPTPRAPEPLEAGAASDSQTRADPQNAP